MAGRHKGRPDDMAYHRVGPRRLEWREDAVIHNTARRYNNAAWGIGRASTRDGTWDTWLVRYKRAVVNGTIWGDDDPTWGVSGIAASDGWGVRIVRRGRAVGVAVAVWIKAASLWSLVTARSGAVAVWIKAASLWTFHRRRAGTRGGPAETVRI